MLAVNKLYDNIPDELKQLNQWIVWKLEDVGGKKPTKVPYNPKTGELASTTNPNTWCSFLDALNTLGNHNNYSGLGFVFTSNDPYAFIDLDDAEGDTVSTERQLKVFKEFDSYAEISPSGKGLHIIIKGEIPNGRRRSNIEIYSSGRYATMTGNVYNNKPINTHQISLTALWEQMGGDGPATIVYQGDDSEKYNDEEIIEMAKTAANGEKFKLLYDGKWQGNYPSQSEADFAFIDIIAFYTQNKTQISRIFQHSSLGNRAKAKRHDYLNWMINKSFDRMLPPIDFDGFKNALEDKLSKVNSVPVAQRLEPAAHNGSVEGSNPSGHTKAPIKIPPGLLGELAQFIYQAAPRPVPEIALAGAIGLMAGICGRAYNISGTGLNQYILCIAPTGSGKEAMAIGIDKLMNEIRLQVPTSNNFIGPSEIASGQALIKYLAKSSACFVSILGEFGLRLENMSSQHANSSERVLKRMLLDLYHKSGKGQIFRPTIFSDSEKNTVATEAPSFSILGESTPERFYGILNEEMIAEGLLPRFMLIEYDGFRPPLNKNHEMVKPSFQLIERFATLVANVEMIMHAKRVIDIRETEEATKLFYRFDKTADSRINETSKEVLRQLWNRAHMKVLKIAGLIAVGVNMSDPVVLPEYVEWAIDMVQSDIRALSSKFESGEIGTASHEGRQQKDLIKVCRDFVTKDFEAVKMYSQSKKDQKLHHDKVIPYAYMSKRLMSNSSYRQDRAGATFALKRTLQNMIDADKMREINKQDMVIKYGTSQRAFVISDPEILNEE